MSTTYETDAKREPSETGLLEIARFEGRKRLRVTGVIALLFALYGLMFLWLGPQLIAGEGIQQMLESLPAIMNELLGFESLTSLEGLFASEFYTFAWMVGLGAYIAYTAAGTVAGDLKADRMDTLLAAPVSRRSVLLGKYLALLVPILILSVVVPLVLYVGSLAIGESLTLRNLAALHALSIPYLLLWAAIGLLLGIVVRGGRTAGRLALALVVFSWLYEAFISITDYDWTGNVSPMRHLDPPAILVDASYDVTGAAGLLAATLVLLWLSQWWFRRTDI